MAYSTARAIPLQLSSFQSHKAVWIYLSITNGKTIPAELPFDEIFMSGMFA